MEITTNACPELFAELPAEVKQWVQEKLGTTQLGMGELEIGVDYQRGDEIITYDPVIQGRISAFYCAMEGRHFVEIANHGDHPCSHAIIPLSK